MCMPEDQGSLQYSKTILWVLFVVKESPVEVLTIALFDTLCFIMDFVPSELALERMVFIDILQ